MTEVQTMDKYMALITLMSAAGMLLAVKGWRGRNRTEKQPVPVRVQSDERQPRAEDKQTGR